MPASIKKTVMTQLAASDLKDLSFLSWIGHLLRNDTPGPYNRPGKSNRPSATSAVRGLIRMAIDKIDAGDEATLREFATYIARGMDTTPVRHPDDKIHERLAVKLREASDRTFVMNRKDWASRPGYRIEAHQYISRLEDMKPANPFLEERVRNAGLNPAWAAAIEFLVPLRENNLPVQAIEFNGNRRLEAEYLPDSNHYSYLEDSEVVQEFTINSMGKITVKGHDMALA